MIRRKRGRLWKRTASLLVLCLLGLTGCARPAAGNIADTSPAVPGQTSSALAQITIYSDEEEPQYDTEYYLPEERKEENGQIRSYLTGQMVDTLKGNRRPVAVMMSNDKAALPQYGINRAGVVYEAPVEGDMNRYMAILEDYDDLDRIGSVRSCRTCYVYFAREFDAVYAHYGQSDFAKPYLKHIDNINGLEAIGTTAYYRSKDRKAPHNAYTGGDRLKLAIRTLGYSDAYDSGYKGHYLFARDGCVLTLDDRPGVIQAVRAEPGYTGNQAYFLYDAADGLYHRYQYGAIHQGSEGPVTVKNVIFQYCQSGFYASTQYRNINVQTPECGYYMTEGKAIPVTWEKDGEFGVTHYYDADHREIVLNQGKTWVCIIPTGDFKKTALQ